MIPRFAPWACLALLAACAAPQQANRGNCVNVPVQVLNASSQAVEQLFLGSPGAWGADLLAGGELAPRAVLNLPRPTSQPFNLRLVWVNGRGAEFPDLNGCTTTRVELGDTGMQAR